MGWQYDFSRKSLLATVASISVAYPHGSGIAQDASEPTPLPPVSVEQQDAPPPEQAPQTSQSQQPAIKKSKPKVAKKAPKKQPSQAAALPASDIEFENASAEEGSVNAGGPSGAGTVSDAGPEDYKIDGLTNPKFTLPILNTARSVQVVPKALLDDTKAKSLEDALVYVPGISLQSGEGNPPSGNQLKVRGFSAAGDIYLDGLRDPAFFFRDTFNVEGIEIIKGPGSADFGRGSTGATINIVTKQPKLGNFSEAEASLKFGEDMESPGKRLTTDFNQQLDGINGGIRISALAEDGGVPGRDHIENERLGFAPSLTLGLTGPTRFNVSYQYFSHEGLPDVGIPLGRGVANIQQTGALTPVQTAPNPSSPLPAALSGREPPVDYSNFYGYLNRDYLDVEQHLVTTSIEHQLSDDTKIASRLRYSHTHNDTVGSSPRFYVAPANGSVTPVVVGQSSTVPVVAGETYVFGQTKTRDEDTEIIISQTDLTQKFHTFGWKHTVVVGAEFADESSENKRRLDTNGPPLDLYNPDNSLNAFQLPYNGTRARVESQTAAIYLRDVIEFTPQWILNGGIRFDYIDTEVQGFRPSSGPAATYGNNTLTGGRSSLEASRTDEEFSWNAGLTYKPTELSSLYFAYGTSFEPVGSLGVSGAGNYQLAGGGNAGPVEPGFYADPETNETYEVGGKWEVLPNNLTLTGAIFRINKENVRNTRETNIDNETFIDGKQRVDGFEITAAGRLTPAWSIFGGYTYLDSEILEAAVNSSRRVGDEIDLVPRNTFSLWTSYNFLEYGLEVGAGATYVDERTSLPGANQVPVTVEDYWRFDAAASYKANETWTLGLYLQNLTDERYIEAVQQGGGQGTPGEGFSALVSLKARFGEK